MRERGAESERKPRSIKTAKSPPAKAAAPALMSLKQHIRSRAEQRAARLEKMRPLLDKIQAPLREQLLTDKATLRALEKIYKADFKLPRESPKRPFIPLPDVPGVPLGGRDQGFVAKFPAYDMAFQWTNASYPTAQAQADKTTGQYKFDATGSCAASAGIGVWFFAYEDTAAQRVSAVLDYDYVWGLWSSMGYTAHNDGATNIWVWGFSENKWVAQIGSLSPFWSDGTGWFESHGSGGYPPVEQYGRETIEGYFPAAANNFYLIWIWSEGSCDNWDSLVGVSYAAQQQKISVPMIVFGEL